jgi:protein-disulfide isomerase
MTNILIALSALLWPLCLSASDEIPPSSGTVLIEIDGAKLTAADLELKRPALFFQARNNYYEAERKAMQDFIDDYLLEREAQKEGVTVSQLMDRHVKAAIPQDPGEEALRVYYEGIDTAEPFEAVRDKIVAALRERRLAKAKTAYLETVRKQASVVIRVRAPRAEISLKDTPVRGRPDAGVTLLEFADFECPYCQQIQPVLDKLMTDYKGRVSLAYKDAPLPMHPRAQKAAEAAHCAGTQGKYWEYHSLLMTNKQLDLPQLKEQARRLELDGGTFDKCLDSGEQAKLVQAQLSEAAGLGVQGTPTFFINGRIVSGVVSYETLRGIVEEELTASAASQKQTAQR